MWLLTHDVDVRVIFENHADLCEYIQHNQLKSYTAEWISKFSPPDDSSIQKAERKIYEELTPLSRVK